MIRYITPEVLADERIVRILQADLEHTYYWSDHWEPEFYRALARAGFISISTDHPDLGSVLVPELQSAYAVLDWERLHISRKVRKILDSGRLEEWGVELRCATTPDRLIEQLTTYHGSETWLSTAYRELLQTLPAGDLPEASSATDDFTLHAVELWSTASDLLVAGELGYSIGRTYTSLSGFCNRTEARWNHFGTLQLVLLARRLEAARYAFWNLGHPQLEYKLELGARVVERHAFLDRWFDATRPA